MNPWHYYHLTRTCTLLGFRRQATWNSLRLFCCVTPNPQETMKQILELLQHEVTEIKVAELAEYFFIGTDF